MDKDLSVNSPMSPPALSRADYVRDFSSPKVPASFVNKLSMDFLALATKQSVENLYFSCPPSSSQEGGGGFRLQCPQNPHPLLHPPSPTHNPSRPT